MTRPSHPCAACGGRGLGRSRATQPQELGVGPGGCCLVCLGAGTFSEQMSKDDAHADAETAWPLLALFGWDDIAATMATLARKGDAEVWKAFVPFARAAFRAVPGLREEKS